MSSEPVRIACVVDGMRLALSSVLLYVSAKQMIPDVEFRLGVPEDAKNDAIAEILATLPDARIIALPPPRKFAGRQYRIMNKVVLMSMIEDERIFLCDSDLLFVRKFPKEYFDSVALGAKIADARSWDGNWAYLYSKFKLPEPRYRVITTTTKEISYPYYNSGFVVARKPKSFGERWLSYTVEILNDEAVEGRFPYADQIAFPLAAASLSLNLTELDIAFNNSIHDFGKNLFILHHHDYYSKLEKTIPALLSHWMRSNSSFTLAFERLAARFDREKNVN